MFDLAIITLNFNSTDHTKRCVRSIIEKTSHEVRYQIIIVDNASEKEEFFELKEFCEEINLNNLELFRSNINLGFGGGHMFGVQFANAKYIAFVNNDILLLNDCLSILTKALEKIPSAGIVGGQVFDSHGQALTSFNHFGSIIQVTLGNRFLETINKKRYPRRVACYNKPIIVNQTAGSLMMVRAVDFFEVGGFDTHIFLYYEETDLCKRLRKIQKYAVYVPFAKFTHVYGASTKKSLLTRKEGKLSFFYMTRKHYGFICYCIGLVYYTIVFSAYSLIHPNHWSLVLMLLRGAPLSDSLKLKQKIKPLEM